jgi:hypothetical protein
MKRVLKYRLEGHKQMCETEFEDGGSSITINNPNSPEVEVLCGGKVILSLLGIRLNFIEII